MTMGDNVKGNVLVVDDTPASLELLAEMLRQSGYAVQAEQNGTAALAAAVADPPDVVLLDVAMPDLDGFQVCERLKQTEKLSDIPVIFLTALSTSSDILRGFEVGGADYITKPFRVEEVLARVNAHASLRQAQRELLEAHRRERTRIEDALRVSEERFTSIFRDSPVPISLTTLGDGIIVEANGAFARLCGRRSAEELIGKSTLELGFFNGDARHRALTTEALRRSPGRLEALLVPLKRPDGDARTVEISSSSYRMDGNDYVLAVSLDITDRLRAEHEQRKAEQQARALEDQLRQAQKMEALGRLAGGIAHDFNNLLSVIISFGELVKMGLEPGHESIRDVDEMIKAGQRAAEMTRQLLAFSRRQMLEPRDLDLNVVLHGIERMLRRMIGEDVTLVTAPAADLGIIRADPGQLEQVLTNLSINARDAMPTGGTLTIATSNVTLDDAFIAHHPGAKPGAYSRLSVTDTGTGMPPDVQARIFEPFFTTKEVGKGTGLGLATVFGIVQQSGGCMTVESEVGKGTRFDVYLPQSAVQAAPPTTASVDSVTVSGTETILVVEDSTELRELSVRILKRNGYTVLAAPGGEDAVALAERHKGTIDLLITDVIMPRMGGRVLADRLRLGRPAMKVLFVSGYHDDVLGLHGVLDPGVMLLPKPFTPALLGQKVRQALV